MSKYNFFEKASAYYKGILKKLKNYELVKFVWNTPKELKIIYFFVLLFLILLIRIFQLQVVEAEEHMQDLRAQHATHTTLEASRWNIYLENQETEEKMQLTENIDIYTLYVDPKFIEEQERFVEKITPVVYRHFCEINWLTHPDEKECIENIEDFTWEEILPEEDDEEFYLLDEADQQVFVDDDTYDEEVQEIIESFDEDEAKDLISEQIKELTEGGIRENNYFWFFNNESLLVDFENADFEYVNVSENYVYFSPDEVEDINNASRNIYEIFSNNWYNYPLESIYQSLQERQIRYVRIVDNMNSKLASRVHELKEEYSDDTTNWVPLLHWLWLEEENKRYYPYEDFASHILWYLTEWWDALYWVEEYFDERLSWEDWEMIWIDNPWIGTIWTNQLDHRKPVDGDDIYLTINPTIQRNLEEILYTYYEDLEADVVSSIIMEADTWKIKAMANYPDFDPNNYTKYYSLEPLAYEDREIVEEDHYMDIPVLIRDDEWGLRMATFDERDDPELEKFVFEEKFWPQTFVDRNISYPSEPGSIFKTFTVALGLDAHEISLNDMYQDEMELEIGPYTIENVQDECEGYHSYLHALDWSCNIWMVRIVQDVWRYVFYSYLEKLWFWEKTWVELAKEESWNITWLENFSRARFLNNSFGQWLLTTPMQIAMGYSAIVNWGYLMQPTVVDKIYDTENNQYIENSPEKKTRVFSEETSQEMLDWLDEILTMEDEEHLGSMVGIPWYSLGWKSWTSQIPLRGEYMRWMWWTTGAFASVVTAENPEYVVVTNVRRPRTTQRGSSTAWLVNRDISKFLIEYNWIEK